jgi:hypothetical protein
MNRDGTAAVTYRHVRGLNDNPRRLRRHLTDTDQSAHWQVYITRQVDTYLIGHVFYKQSATALIG